MTGALDHESRCAWARECNSRCYYLFGSEGVTAGPITMSLSSA